MAAETKLIPTFTTINVSGNDISILTYYNQDIEIIEAFIADISSVREGVVFTEGDGGIFQRNSRLTFILSGDDDGDLLVIGDNADQFSLDEDTGQLVQTIN